MGNGAQVIWPNYVKKPGDTMTGNLAIQVPTATVTALTLKTTDDSSTDPIEKFLSSDGTLIAGLYEAATAKAFKWQFNSTVAGSPWAFEAGGATFISTFDPIMVWGYNVSNAGARINTADANGYWQIEANYDDGTRHNIETHFDTTAPDGTARRWFGLTVQRDAPDTRAIMSFSISPTGASGEFQINRSDTGANLYKFVSDGSMIFNAPSSHIVFGQANPYIQATPNTPLAFIANSKYVWVNNATDGLQFGSSRDANLYRTAASAIKTDGSFTAGGVIFPQQAATASAPTYVKGGIYFDTTLNKLRVGGASGWETVTSA